MNSMQQKIKAYVLQIWQKKFRLILAAVVFLVLFLLSCKFLYTGINKRFILFSGLSFATALFMMLPRLKKWYFSALALGIYLVVVPLKIFQRMELPIHDMNRLLEGAELVNILIIFLVYGVCLLVFQRIPYALAGGNVILLILFVINYYLTQFRGTTLCLDDLLASGTALTVIDNYQFAISSELWYSILYFCFFIVFGFWCDIPGKGKKYHILITAAALLYCLVFGIFWGKTDYLENHELKWYPDDNQENNGFLLSFGLNMKEASMKKPEGYSYDMLKAIAEEAGSSYGETRKTEITNPNIILIMNEAWSDLRVLGNFETTEDYMPFVNSLKENVLKGNTYVSIQGGLTANSEFEVLTGDSLAFFLPSVIPYNLQVRRDMSSLASVLGEQGYTTIAMHPNGAGSWNRDKVYKYFGFDDFVDIEDFQTEISYVGNFISDQTNFNEIIWHYENRDKEKPFFLFDVTIQNHADYYYQVETPIKIEKVGNTPANEIQYLHDAETYINLMKITDDAFRSLVQYFESIEEPTIICMFGDHQPVLKDCFYEAVFADSGLTEEEQQQQKYITPYLIWTNYDMEFEEYGDMNASYLGAALLECAGVELPDYYKFLLNLQKEYPVISRWNLESLQQEEKIIQYQMLEYNHLVDKKSHKSIFSVLLQ